MPSPISENVLENLSFLAAEVDAQMRHLENFLAEPSAVNYRKIIDRSGYVSNLRIRIQNGCAQSLAGKRGSSARLALNSVGLIATDLERMTEKCRDAVNQLEGIAELSLVHPQACRRLLKNARKGVRMIEPAIKSQDSSKAVALARIPARMDAACDGLVAGYVKALKGRSSTERTQELTRALFMAQSLRQTGDSLRRASESILSMNLGQSISFERYSALQSLRDKLPGSEELAITSVAETRSGSAVAGLASDQKGDNTLAILKDGQKHKLKAERAGVQSWHEVYPGLAPRILAYRKRGESAALLIEHLSGLTFEQIVLNESKDLLDETLKRLGKTLRSVWRETRSRKACSAGFMQQLEARLPAVYDVHPHFYHGKTTLCGLAVPSYQQLMRQARRREKSLKAPFSVYIHGDFNVDNIIYDPAEKRINFIDLHRSRHMDYVQDVSVFMVSNYRLQVTDAAVRDRTTYAALKFYEQSRNFARREKDSAFELRLALGLARSFATSTRFILDKPMATGMLLRSRYLLELFLSHGERKPSSFRLPLEEIFRD
ncbi:MAG: phosphotransferase [Pseudomonadota bacterium]